MTEADIEARRRRWLEVERSRWKAAVRAEVERRGLASFMNAARWTALTDAIYAELPFPPAFQLQTVLGEHEALLDPDTVWGWGDWSALEPHFAVEWLRVFPRYRKHVGMLVPDETVECAGAFRELLVRLRVPFREDDAETFWIYGYAPADPATLTDPVKEPT